jgi:hypothetical protein
MRLVVLCLLEPRPLESQKQGDRGQNKIELKKQDDTCKIIYYAYLQCVHTLMSRLIFSHHNGG